MRTLKINDNEVMTLRNALEGELEKQYLSIDKLLKKARKDAEFSYINNEDLIQINELNENIKSIRSLLLDLDEDDDLTDLEIEDLND